MSLQVQGGWEAGVKVPRTGHDGGGVCAQEPEGPEAPDLPVLEVPAQTPPPPPGALTRETPVSKSLRSGPPARKPPTLRGARVGLPLPPGLRAHCRRGLAAGPRLEYPPIRHQRLRPATERSARPAVLARRGCSTPGPGTKPAASARPPLSTWCRPRAQARDTPGGRRSRGGASERGR